MTAGAHRLQSPRPIAVTAGLAVGFWHFMGLVWLYVLGILTVLG